MAARIYCFARMQLVALLGACQSNQLETEQIKAEWAAEPAVAAAEAATWPRQSKRKGKGVAIKATEGQKQNHGENEQTRLQSTGCHSRSCNRSSSQDLLDNQDRWSGSTRASQPRPHVCPAERQMTLILTVGDPTSGRSWWNAKHHVVKLAW
jgi:hypothetical protein